MHDDDDVRTISWTTVNTWEVTVPAKDYDQARQRYIDEGDLEDAETSGAAVLVETEREKHCR